MRTRQSLKRSDMLFREIDPLDIPLLSVDGKFGASLNLASAGKAKNNELLGWGVTFI